MPTLDLILQIRLVQYLLLGLSITLIVLAVWLEMANLTVKAQLAVAEKNLKGYEYATALQNEGIKQMQQAGELAKQKAQDALKAAQSVRQRREGNVITIMKRPAPAACEEARQYGLDLARQLVEGRP